MVAGRVGHRGVPRCGPAPQHHAGRGATSAMGREVTVYLRRSQSEQLLQDIAHTGEIAVVFSVPSTHQTLQLKARWATQPSRMTATCRCCRPTCSPWCRRWARSATARSMASGHAGSAAAGCGGRELHAHQRVRPDAGPAQAQVCSPPGHPHHLRRSHEHRSAVPAASALPGGCDSRHHGHLRP